MFSTCILLFWRNVRRGQLAIHGSSNWCTSQWIVNRKELEWRRSWYVPVYLTEDISVVNQLIGRKTSRSIQTVKGIWMLLFFWGNLLAPNFMLLSFFWCEYSFRCRKNYNSSYFHPQHLTGEMSVLWEDVSLSLMNQGWNYAGDTHLEARRGEISVTKDFDGKRYNPSNRMEHGYDNQN